MINGICKFCLQKFTKKYAAQKFCSLLCSNRYNLNNANNPIIPEEPNEDMAELFGILLGDGSVTKYYAKIYLNAKADINYIPIAKNLSAKLFPGASVTIQERPSSGTTDIQISSRVVCDYLRYLKFDPKKRFIPDWITQNKNFIKATIRGLFDTEGSVGIKYFQGKTGKYLYKQLTVTNRNENILKFLETSLIALGYKPTKKSQKNIYISNKPDILKFIKEIKPHNPKIKKKAKIEEINGYTWRVGRMAMH